MNATTTRNRYGQYERQRLLRLLTDLHQSRTDMSWVSMAHAISKWRKTHFQRMCFYRLKEPEKHGELSDENVEIIVAWMEDNFDADIRERLKPQAIFGELGKVSRDYYFHISSENVLEDWDENLLRRFSGVYLCAPDNDINSYMPISQVREWIKNEKGESRSGVKNRSLDVNQYIQKRSILILQYCDAFHYYAAEFPLSLLLPDSIQTSDLLMVCEGVGIVSSNSIHVQMRDCLSRVPKTISIVIKPKPQQTQNQPNAISLYTSLDLRTMANAWKSLSPHDVQHMKDEYKLSLDNDMTFVGTAQYSWSPVASISNAIDWSMTDTKVFHPKPKDFLRRSDIHLLFPGFDNEDQIQKIIDNPLAMCELL